MRMPCGAAPEPETEGKTKRADVAALSARSPRGANQGASVASAGAGSTAQLSHPGDLHSRTVQRVARSRAGEASVRALRPAARQPERPVPPPACAQSQARDLFPAFAPTHPANRRPPLLALTNGSAPSGGGRAARGCYPTGPATARGGSALAQRRRGDQTPYAWRWRRCGFEVRRNGRPRSGGSQGPGLERDGQQSAAEAAREARARPG